MHNTHPNLSLRFKHLIFFQIWFYSSFCGNKTLRVKVAKVPCNHRLLLGSWCQNQIDL